jgi:hypothetical protein
MAGYTCPPTDPREKEHFFRSQAPLQSQRARSQVELDALGLPRVHGVQMVAERVLPALQPAALLHDPHEVTAYREPGPHKMNDAPGVHINGPFQLFFFLNPAGRLIRFQK